jgi:transcriptional regulator of acetoin/glycerol metabolism
MSNVAMEHVNRVRSVVQSRNIPERVGTANRITPSWIRCLEEYWLDPGTCAEPEVGPATELRERQERLADVQAAAKVKMANLYQQLAGSRYAIMFTDRESALLNYFGDPAFIHAASKTGLMQGAVSSERAQGTKGMDTCLFERRPVAVHRDEHDLSRNIGLSCAAAPIFDQRETDRRTEHDLLPEYRTGEAGATPAPSTPGSTLNTLESAERRALLQVLRRHAWKLSSVARELDISRNTRYRKLQRLNIRPPEKSLGH